MLGEKAIMLWFLNFIATLVPTAALLAFAAWLLRTWIAERLTASIRLETEQKLAAFQSRLDAAEAQVSDARRAGIDALHQSNAALLAERVLATKEIWKGVVDWQRATAINMIVAAFTESTARDSAGHPGTKSTFEPMLKNIDYLEIGKRANAVAAWRPFVSEKAWALWVACNAFYGVRITKAAMLMFGNKEMVTRLWQVNAEAEIVRNTTTAEIVAEFARNEVAGTQKALSYIEGQLLAELKRGLAGEESGPEAARQAANIIAVAQSAIAKTQELASQGA
jgi:hypothetical protein